MPFVTITLPQKYSRSPCYAEFILGKTRTTRTHVLRIPPPPHDYPYYWVILDAKSKEDKVKATNFKNLPKLQIIEIWYKLYTLHTYWSCLIRCANMKWIQWVLLKIQSWHDSVYRQTDGQTDRGTDGRTRWNQYTPGFNFVEAGGLTRTIRTPAFCGCPTLPHD